MKLLCFPYLGSLDQVYENWLSTESSKRIVPISYHPGNSFNTSARSSNASELLQFVRAQVIPHALEPFSFFGHSMGAYVAFLVLKELEAMGLAKNCRHLMVSGASPGMEEKQISQYSNRALWQHLGSLGQVNPQLEASGDHQEFFCEILRADFRLCESLSELCVSPIACNSTVFLGREDSAVHKNAAQRWKRLLPNSEAEYFDGGHFFPFTNQSRVAERVEALLSECIE